MTILEVLLLSNLKAAAARAVLHRKWNLCSPAWVRIKSFVFCFADILIHIVLCFIIYHLYLYTYITTIYHNCAIYIPVCMVGILKDLILAATHQMDFRHNEVAQEVLAQLLSYQSKMPSLIEQALMSDAEVCVFECVGRVLLLS